MNGHHALAEAMRRHGQTPGNDSSLPRICTISSYDPDAYAIKALIQPENVESNWMPLGSIGVGNRWGVAIGPQLGDQVLVVFQEGDFSSGVVVARLFSVKQGAPRVESGEIAIQHASGSLLRFNSDGSVSLVCTGTLNSSAPAWNHTGPMTVNGDVVINGDEQVTGAITGQGGMAVSGGSGATVDGNLAVTDGNVTADGVSLKTHTHGGVQGGSENTGAPN